MDCDQVQEPQSLFRFLASREFPATVQALAMEHNEEEDEYYDEDADEDNEEEDDEDFEEEQDNNNDDKEPQEEEGEEVDPTISQCAICFSTNVALVNLPCCGGTTEESSTTRFCRNCVIKTLKGDQERQSYRPSGASTTLVGECPRCRYLITVYDRSKAGSPIQEASLEQRVHYMKFHQTYAQRILFIIAHIHSQYIPLQLIKWSCLAEEGGERQQAIHQETLRLLIKWNILESTTLSRNGNDNNSKTIYRIVATSDRHGRLSSLASQEVIRTLMTARANRPAFFEQGNRQGSPIRDDKAWTKHAWDHVCDILLSTSGKTLSDGHIVCSVRMANQALICWAKSFGMFPSLYQSPILGVLSVTCASLGLVCAVVGGVGYSLVLGVAYWSRTSEQAKNQFMLQLGLHTVFLGLGMSIKMQFTAAMIKFGINKGLAWMFPKIPPRLVNLGSKAIGLGVVLWIFDVSKVGGLSSVARSAGAIVGWEL